MDPVQIQAARPGVGWRQYKSLPGVWIEVENPDCIGVVGGGLGSQNDSSDEAGEVCIEYIEKTEDMAGSRNLQDSSKNKSRSMFWGIGFDGGWRTQNEGSDKAGKVCKENYEKTHEHKSNLLKRSLLANIF